MSTCRHLTKLVAATVLAASPMPLSSVAAQKTGNGQGPLQITIAAPNGVCAAGLAKGDPKSDAVLLNVPPGSTNFSVTWNEVAYGHPRWELEKNDVYRLQRPESGELKNSRVLATVKFKKNGTEIVCNMLVFNAMPDPDLEASKWWMLQLTAEAEGNPDNAYRKLKNAMKVGYLAKARKSQRKRLQDRPSRLERKLPELLVHLPSGAVAPPSHPSDVTEGKPLQMAIIADESNPEPGTLEIEECDTPATFRATEDTEVGAEQREHQARLIGPTLKCGPPALRYKIGTASDPNDLRKHKLRVNPKYHITGIVSIGWDTARNNEYYSATVAAENGVNGNGMNGNGMNGNGMTGTMMEEPQIAWRSTTAGVIAYVGAQWMIGGVDYHNMRWWNYFGNLFVSVNIVSPLEDLAIGGTITPTGGLGVSLGVTLHKRTELDRGAQVGDPLPTGDPPTRRAWSNPSVGLFVGFSIDTNIFRALKARAKSTGLDES